MNYVHAAAVLGALIFAPVAGAISVRVVEDTPSRFTFDVVWGSELPGDGDEVAQVDGGQFVVRAHDLLATGLVSAETRFGLDSFDILFDWVEARAFADAVLDSFDGAQFLALEGEAYGGRFVYGAPYVEEESEELPAVGVPDGGCTLAMMVVAGAGLGWWGRRRNGVGAAR